MLRITDRDRVFAAVAVPLGLAVAFLLLVHRPLAGRVAGCRERLAELGDRETLAMERVSLERARDEGRAARKAAEADDAARRAAEGGAVGAPERLRRMAALLGGAEGVRVRSTAPVEETAEAPSPAAATLAVALGGARPATWRFDVTGDYASVLRALRTISERKVPAVVESVSLDGARSWRIEICL